KGDKKSARRRFLDSEKLGISQYIPVRSYTDAELLVLQYDHQPADSFPLLQPAYDQQPDQNRSGYEPDGFSCPTCCGNEPAYDAPGNPKRWSRKRSRGRCSVPGSILPGRKFCKRQSPCRRYKG